MQFECDTDKTISRYSRVHRLRDSRLVSAMRISANLFAKLVTRIVISIAATPVDLTPAMRCTRSLERSQNGCHTRLKGRCTSEQSQVILFSSQLVAIS